MSDHKHSASDITSGTLGLARGGTNATTGPAAIYQLTNPATAMTTAALASNDYLPIVDTSASTGKKISLERFSGYIKNTINPISSSIICNNTHTLNLTAGQTNGYSKYFNIGSMDLTGLPQSTKGILLISTKIISNNISFSWTNGNGSSSRIISFSISLDNSTNTLTNAHTDETSLLHKRKSLPKWDGSTYHSVTYLNDFTGYDNITLWEYDNTSDGFIYLRSFSTGSTSYNYLQGEDVTDFSFLSLSISGATNCQCEYTAGSMVVELKIYQLTI